MLKRTLFGGGEANPLSTDVSLLLFRTTCGRPLMTVIEKLFPKDGRWGPQDWFIADAAELGVDGLRHCSLYVLRIARVWCWTIQPGIA